MIYALEILDWSFIKIGFSADDDVNKRIAQLQTGCPFEIKPIFTTFGTLSQEKSLHAMLRTAMARVNLPHPPNEWYPGRTPFVVDFLEYLKYGPDAGMAYLAKYNPAVKQYGHARGKVGLSQPRWPFPKAFRRDKSSGG